MDETTTTKTFWTRRRRLWAAGSAATILALGAAGHVLPDWGLRYGLERTLRDLGWPQVSVSDADLSLFNGAVVVRHVQAGEALGRMLGIDGLDLRFRWRPLFSRRVSVESLDLEGLDIDILRDGGGWVINGLPLAVSGGDSSGTSWTYDITALNLSDSRLHVADGTTRLDVELDRLEVRDLKSWEPAVPVSYRLSGRVNGARFEVDGTATPFATKAAFGVVLKLEGFDLAAVAEAAKAAGAGQLSGRIDADLRLDGDDGGTVSTSGKLALANGGWADGTTRLGAKRLDLSLDNARWAGGRLEASGTATSDGLTVEDNGVTVAATALRLQARSAAWDGKSQRLSWDGTLHAEHHQVAAPGVRIEHGSLDWTGATRFDFSPKAQSFLHAEGRAEAGAMRATIGELVTEAQRLTAEGVFEHARADGMLPPLAGRMEVTAEALAVREPGRDWLRADKVEAHELKLTPGSNASLTRLEARGIGLLARPGRNGFPWRLEARQLVVDRTSLAADGSGSVAALSLNGAIGRVTLTKGGLLGLPEDKADGNTPAATEPPRMVLNRLRLGGDSRIEFEDRTLGEPVRLRLEGIDATLADLDSARPDRDSPFTAKARIGAAHLSAQGKARPFATAPGGEVKGEIRALELPPLSPYAADKLGVHLQTGQLDADWSLSASQGKLDGGMQLTLSELFIAQPDPNAPLAKSADMPVETVLDLLRDSENRIRLSIPVRGDLANPDFDISDAVGQAVGGALKSTVFTTLKVAFPLAGLISLAIDDAESRRLALEPLAFPPGAEALGEGERKRLAAVAGLMGQRPTLRLTLCGVATQAGDGPALAERKRQEELGLFAKIQKMMGSAPPPLGPQDRDRLVELADSRAQAAKAYLVDEAGINPGRLFTCRPRVETDAAALPRVDLVL